MAVLAPSVIRWWPLAEAAARTYQVPVSWVLATVQMETKGNPDKVSFSGFRGLMQIGNLVSQDWAAGRGQPNPWPSVLDPAINLLIGAWFLGWCSRRVSSWCSRTNPEHPAWVRACYGWGPGNLAKAVAAAASELGKPPTFSDLERLNPDAGTIDGVTYVRPWTGGRRFAALVAAIDREPVPATGQAGAAAFPVLGLLVAGGLLLVIGALLVMR
jgi:hypothetical protein